MIIYANPEALVDITTCTLVNCCDHIQVACSNLVATNSDMRRKLEMVISTLLDLVEIYMRIVKNKITEVEAKKQALIDALVDNYALMNKVHDWPGSLALKNHLVYPMRE